MNRKAIIIGVIAAIVVIGAGVIALGGSSKKDGMNLSASSSAVSTNNVSIQNYMFGPMVIKVKVGTMVTWTNKDSVSHTITADNTSSAAPSSMDIGQGKSYSFKFMTAGTYTYHCFPHPYMHGTVIVTN